MNRSEEMPIRYHSDVYKGLYSAEVQGQSPVVQGLPQTTEPLRLSAPREDHLGEEKSLLYAILHGPRLRQSAATGEG